MPRTQNEVRNKRMVIRVTVEEEASLKEAASQSHITPTDYIRTKALDQPRTFRTTASLPAKERLLCRALGELGQIGSELRIVRDIMSWGDIPVNGQVETALARVVEASEAIMKSLGLE